MFAVFIHVRKIKVKGATMSQSCISVLSSLKCSFYSKLYTLSCRHFTTFTIIASNEDNKRGLISSFKPKLQ